LVPFGTLRNIIQRAAPDSEVRSSTQSTTDLPASAACSSGVCGRPRCVPGGGGGGWSFGGIGGIGNGSFGASAACAGAP
jgi:hypothetical protein